MKNKFLYMMTLLVFLLGVSPCVTAAEKPMIDPELRVILLGWQQGKIRPCG